MISCSYGRNLRPQTLQEKNEALSGTGDSQRDSRESFAIKIPIFKARQADSRKSLEFLIRANRVICANHANRFARIVPLRRGFLHLKNVKFAQSCFICRTEQAKLPSTKVGLSISNISKPIFAGTAWPCRQLAIRQAEDREKERVITPASMEMLCHLRNHWGELWGWTKTA